MSLPLFQQFFGIILFFLPGTLLSYIIAQRTDIIKRTVYAVLLSPLIAVLLGILLHFLGLFNPICIVSSLIFLNLFFLLTIFILKIKTRTYFNHNLWYLLFFSLTGTLWRILFLKSISNFSDTYGYSYKFIENSIPNLGFYTGMAIDHSRFIVGDIFFRVCKFLYLDNFINFVGIFLMTFLFLGFIHLIFSEYRNKKLAFIGVALMSLGPIEIFYSTAGFFGHSFSYLALFSLFLLYRSEDKSYFPITLLLSITMVFTYFTSAMINFLVSIGFIVSIFIKGLYREKHIKYTVLKCLKNQKLLFFMLIAIISSLFIFGSYSLKEYKSGNLQLVTKHIISYPLMRYHDPTFLGLSAIRWQMLFFFLCGLSLIFYLINKRFDKKSLLENADLILCSIPVLIVSFMFFYSNLPTRIFNYFAFFGLLAIKIPRKYLRSFFILSFIFIFLTSWFVAKDKRVFFETSDKEIEGALWINNSLKGKIFSDQPFVNQLVLNGYYNVTGAYDDDPLIYNLFYQNDSYMFLNAVNTLTTDLNARYIVITKRMQQKYILMVNVPQKPLININVYERYLEKIYDNGDSRVYKTNKAYTDI